MSVNPARQEVFQLAINRENVDWKYRIRIGWNSLARDADLKEAAGVCGGRVASPGAHEAGHDEKAAVSKGANKKKVAVMTHMIEPMRPILMWDRERCSAQCPGIAVVPLVLFAKNQRRRVWSPDDTL